MRDSFDLKARLSEMGLSPKKALGQNFLINTQVIARIIEAVRLRAFSDLIELGPGLGALTEPLLEGGARPRLLELDKDLIAYWQGRGLDVTAGDALQLDWQTLNLRSDSLLVSNLPYQISTSLVVERCLAPKELRWMVLMFQKEVAQRLTAEPRSEEYGVLSVLAQLHFKIKKVADAAPRDFFPAPKVASRVLSFERLPDPDLGVPFLKFLKAAFAFRRKFLLKNLKGVVDKSKQERLVPALKELGFTEKARAEELAPQQLAELFKKIHG
jgi:16S rRNA (adenine1518-N6/adenine1519-N6)-dimethyltransferase